MRDRVSDLLVEKLPLTREDVEPFPEIDFGTDQSDYHREGYCRMKIRNKQSGTLSKILNICIVLLTCIITIEAMFIADYTFDLSNNGKRKRLYFCNIYNSRSRRNA